MSCAYPPSGDSLIKILNFLHSLSEQPMTSIRDVSKWVAWAQAANLSHKSSPRFEHTEYKNIRIRALELIQSHSQGFKDDRTQDQEVWEICPRSNSSLVKELGREFSIQIPSPVLCLRLRIKSARISMKLFWHHSAHVQGLNAKGKYFSSKLSS